MRQRGREGLHVEAVANLRLLGRADVFHDVTNLASAFKRDGQAPVHLCVVPVHFGQSKDLFAQALEG